MPFTPYHFGANGFAGLLLGRWLDPLVLLGVNAVVDLEVLAKILMDNRWPYHRHWHFHTFIGGAIVGAVFGLACYYIKPIRWIFSRLMEFAGLGYRPGVCAMVAGGVVGAWMHVFIDSLCHYDMQPFWPWGGRLLRRVPGVEAVQQWLTVLLIASVVLYVVKVLLQVRGKGKTGDGQKTGADGRAGNPERQG